MDAHHGLGPVTSKVYIGEPGPGTIIVKCQSYWNLLSGVAWSSCLPIAALYPPLWLRTGVTMEESYSTIYNFSVTATQLFPLDCQALDCHI